MFVFSFHRNPDKFECAQFPSEKGGKKGQYIYVVLTGVFLTGNEDSNCPFYSCACLMIGIFFSRLALGSVHLQLVFSLLWVSPVGHTHILLGPLALHLAVTGLVTLGNYS
jgi:hypothetical protein